MAHTIEGFAADCKRALSAAPGPAGREKVRKLLEAALRDETFVNACVGPDNEDQRKILYQDPDLGFCILAHVYKGPKDSPPHDHGPTWAIYGQAAGTTVMREYRRVKAPGDGMPGLVQQTKQYDMTPGMAQVYNEGDLHSPHRASETRLIRIEGRNMETVKRDAFVIAETAS